MSFDTSPNGPSTVAEIIATLGYWVDQGEVNRCYGPPQTLRGAQGHVLMINSGYGVVTFINQSEKLDPIKLRYSKCFS